MIWGLHLTDILSIVAYFSVTIWIGYRAAKKVKNQEDYFMGGRNFGKWIQTFAAFGQGTSAESVVTTTSGTSKSGAAGGWLIMATGVIALPFLWFIPLILRRLRLLNMAAFFTDRYQSKSMSAFYAITQAIFFMLVAAMGFKAMTKTVSAIAIKPTTELTQAQNSERERAIYWETLEKAKAADLTPAQVKELNDFRALPQAERPHQQFSYINHNYLMMAVGLMVLLYAVAGGLEAAFVTDMIQGIFILILTGILIPFAWIKVSQLTGENPFTAFHTELPGAMLELFGSPRLADFTWYYLLAFAFVGGLNLIAPANQMTACGSAKDDSTARIGFFSGIVIKRFCTVVWIFIGMLMAILYSGSVQDPDAVWGTATRDLLGNLNMGLVGLMIACLLAALMSTADALMLTTSSLLTNNVYRLIFPGKEDSHYLFVGKILCICYIVGGIVIAIFSGSIIEMFIFMALFNAMVAAAIWMGIIWRRANATAAWVSIIATFCMILVLPLLIPLIPGVKTSKDLLAKTEPIVTTAEYTATKGDVKRRDEKIEEWKKQNLIGKAEGEMPKPLTIGEKYTDSYTIEGRPIYWKNIITNKDGQLEGDGGLRIELYALSKLGVPLEKLPPSLNSTIAVLLLFFIPFGIMLLVGRFTKPQDSKHLDVFFAKLRTPVVGDHAEDARNMELTTANPSRFDEEKLFSKESNWEFRRWKKDDWMGIVYSFLAMAGIIGLLWGMLNIG